MNRVYFDLATTTIRGNPIGHVSVIWDNFAGAVALASLNTAPTPAEQVRGLYSAFAEPAAFLFKLMDRPDLASQPSGAKLYKITSDTLTQIPDLGRLRVPLLILFFTLSGVGLFTAVLHPSPSGITWLTAYTTSD
jgi:hypothetical protein